MQVAIDEAMRVTALLAAQDKAVALCEAITERQLIQPGRTEKEVGAAIYDLAKELYGVTKHWHRQIVRAGLNTLQPYFERPPVRGIEEDDIVFLDLGPIFEAWEADFGRTYVLGNDPLKCKIRDDLEPIWQAGKQYFEAHADISGAELYDYVVQVTREAGWEFGAPMAGHLVGEFPHQGLKPGDAAVRIEPGNSDAMRGYDQQGRIRHWILELHIVDRARQIGGFYEQLLTLG